MNMYTYKLEWYNEIENKIETNYGIVLGDSYTNAVKDITTYYGEGNVESFSIQYQLMSSDDKPIIECTKETLDTLLNDETFNS